MLKIDCYGGIYGKGDYTMKSHRHAYNVWQAILRRTNGNYEAVGAHEGCTIAGEWLEFQVFAEWATNQIGYDEAGWHLDKDLLVKGNKHYCADRCSFVPPIINNSVKTTKNRFGLPTGIRMDSVGKRYVATLDTKYLGVYDTPAQANEVYQKHLGRKLQRLADEYKGRISDRVYDALMKWNA